MGEVEALVCVGVEASDIARWHELVFEVLGFLQGDGAENGVLHLRMDERGSGIVLEPSSNDRVTAVGWEVRDQIVLAELRDRLAAADYVVKDMSPEEAQGRLVEEGFLMDVPGGTPVLDHSPVVTKYAHKLVTGDQGLGHVVAPSTNFDETYRFYSHTLGFLPRGAMRLPVTLEYGVQRTQFLGVNQRHHSLALILAPEGRDPGLVHVMVELDAVERALDQVTKRDFPVSSTLGRHTNDKMISFHVRVPGAWDIEYGAGGGLVDETYYTSQEISADSNWGHEWAWATH